MTTPEELNRLSLSDFKRLFASLQPPYLDSLFGYYRGSFTGPAWLRAAAKPTLVVTGLGGWWGKRFLGGGKAVNLVRRQGAIRTVFPMQLIEEVSRIDGKPGLSLHYPRPNPVPWPWIVDELRVIQSDLVLGLTMLKSGPLRGFNLPFLLQSLAGPPDE